MGRTAALVIIGNEILSGKVQDQNSPYFIRELRGLGVEVLRVSVIPDDLDTIAAEVRALSQAHDYVFTSGGVGPTHDDLTMKGIALAFDREMQRNEELESNLAAYYPDSLLEANLRMADVPSGARLVRGERSRFPVVAVDNVYIFPGVPSILQRKFESIRETFRDTPFYLKEILVHADEGQIAGVLHRVLASYPTLGLGSYPFFNGEPTLVKLTMESKDEALVATAHHNLFRELQKLGLKPE